MGSVNVITLRCIYTERLPFIVYRHEQNHETWRLPSAFPRSLPELTYHWQISPSYLRVVV